MLTDVLRRVRAKRLAVASSRMKAHRIHFVISQNGEGAARFNHRAHCSQDLADLGPPIDEIAQEDGFPALRMLKGSVCFRVAKSSQKHHKFICMTVDVSNDVVSFIH